MSDSTRIDVAPCPDSGTPATTTRTDWLFLAVVLTVALVVRVYGPWATVFPPTHVNLLESDGWYHLRAIESLVHNFPHHLRTDPFALAGGQYVPMAPLFDVALGTVAWAVGLGHPSGHTIAVIAVFAPPVFGVITVLLVYLAAREFAGGRAGLLAATLAATMPGHFLDRTLLGFVDHHALEALLSTLLLYLLLRALRPNTAIASAALVSGGVLAAYLLTWTSGAFLVAVLIVWMALVHATAPWHPAIASRLSRLVAGAALVAVVIVWWCQDPALARRSMQLASLLALAGVAVAGEGARAVSDRLRWSPAAAPGLVALAGAGSLLALRMLAPSLTEAVLGDLLRFGPAPDRMQVLEARPLFLYMGSWSLAPAWELFRSGFYVGVAALAAVLVRVWRLGDAASGLVAVWGLSMLAATLGQNRFGYYLVPIAALLGGWLAAAAIAWGRRVGGTARTLVVIAVAGLVFAPSVVPAIWTTGRPSGLPSAWVPAYDWLQQHTPEPFGDPRYYDANYAGGPLRPPAYAVMAWWDAGYWLTYLARRVPVANPTQAGAGTAAAFFTATSEAVAVEWLARAGARYVVADEQLAFVPAPDGALAGKFEGIATYAGQPLTRFYQSVLMRDAGGQAAMRFVFTADYYRTMAFRLAALGGLDAAPAAGAVTVMTTVTRRLASRDADVAEVVAMTDFSSYEAAEAYERTLPPGDHRIVGRDPRRPIVALSRLARLRAAYVTPAPGAFGTGAVRVFEVISR